MHYHVRSLYTATECITVLFSSIFLDCDSEKSSFSIFAFTLGASRFLWLSLTVFGGIVSFIWLLN